MNYMYIEYGEDPRQSEEKPNAHQLEACCEGLLEIYKFENGKFFVLTPIDSTDDDNWTEVEQ